MLAWKCLHVFSIFKTGRPTEKWIGHEKRAEKHLGILVCSVVVSTACLIENRNSAISSLKFQEDTFGISEVPCVQTDGGTNGESL